MPNAKETMNKGQDTAPQVVPEHSKLPNRLYNPILLKPLESRNKMRQNTAKIQLLRLFQAGASLYFA